MASLFDPLVPTGLVPLKTDYKNLQNNNQQLDTTFGIDHTLFSNKTTENGYHTVIHQIPFPGVLPNYPSVTAPTITTGFGQIFQSTTNDGISTDQALVFLSGNGNKTLLTRNFQPVSSANGYTFLAGGLILQWGTFTATNISNKVITFSDNNIAFPAFCYNIQVSYVVNDASTIRSGILSGSVSKTGFTWIGTSTSSLISIYWSAIGK